MRGPKDGTVDAGVLDEGAAPGVPAERPRGGKALTRLLSLLASKGYTDVALDTVEGTLPEDAREKQLVQSFCLRPSAAKRMKRDGWFAMYRSMTSAEISVGSTIFVPRPRHDLHPRPREARVKERRRLCEAVRLRRVAPDGAERPLRGPSPP